VKDRFDEIRREITANDEAIVAAVNRRIALVTELWELKAALGYATVDPDRERLLREHLAAASAGPLSAEGLDRFLTDLLDLTKRELGHG
jgi:chorismate mutase